MWSSRESTKVYSGSMSRALSSGNHSSALRLPHA
jgi:hypothetical protein